MTRWRTDVLANSSDLEQLSHWWNGQPAPREIPYLHTDLLLSWVSAFVGPREQLQIRVLFKDDEPVAAMPMFQARNDLRSLSHHSDPFDVVVSTDSETLEYLPRWIHQSGTARFFKLRQQSPLVTGLNAESRWWLEGFRRSLYVDLSQGIEAAREETIRNHRRGLRRRWRRLEEMGEVRLVDHPEADQVSVVLQRCLELEASGWKGEKGRAILQRPDHERWQRGLVEAAQHHGWLRLSTLSLNDQLIAFALDLVYGANRYGLLTSYDESPDMARLSVGNLLLDKILELSASDGLDAYQMGHGSQEAKLHWTDQSHTIYDMSVYGGGPVASIQHLRRSLRTRLGKADPPRDHSED